MSKNIYYVRFNTRVPVAIDGSGVTEQLSWKSHPSSVASIVDGGVSIQFNGQVTNGRHRGEVDAKYGEVFVPWGNVSCVRFLPAETAERYSEKAKR